MLVQTVWVQIRRPKTDANSVESYDTAAHELQTKPDSYANNVDPDETACLSRLTRIYTVCHSVVIIFFFFLLYILTFLFATIQVLKSKMEELTSETLVLKGLGKKTIRTKP